MAASNLRFGPFDLQPHERRLLLNGTPVTLGARAFDLLLALAARPGQLCTKAELLEEVWPGLVVEEANLSVQISALRKVLGDDFIATIPGRGYRFTGTLAQQTAELPASPIVRRTMLPAATTEFVGRADEIRMIGDFFRKGEVRLCTITGVGGTGKSRLAVEVARSLMDDYADGIVFVPLAAILQPEMVLPTIAHTLGVRESAGEHLGETLGHAVHDKRLLLVLDNFEQVIEAANVVSMLLEAAPGLSVLVTSREFLKIAGERAYAVEPLAVPDLRDLPSLEVLASVESVALFMARAREASPGLQLAAHNASDVAEICCRLEGLPLALELAAARARVVPIARMGAELDDRLGFLVGGPRNEPARRRTLRATIDWSYQFLTPSEEAMFRKLAVFVDGGTLEAIEAVCSSEPPVDTIATLESLLAKSLVRRTGTPDAPRFAMLETIREYAREKLIAAGEAAHTRQRHRDFFLALAEDAEPEMKGAQQAKWLQRLEEEHDNLRAALDWSFTETEAQGGLRLCAALQKFWQTRGHLAEGREWCVHVLAKPGGEAPTSLRTKVLNAAGVIASHQGDFAAARALHEESLAIRRKLGLRRSIAASLNNLGNVAAQQRDFAYARPLYEESLSINRELGNRQGISNTLTNLGIVARELGDFVASRKLVEESLAIRRELGDRGGIGLALRTLANLALDEGDSVSARVQCAESLAIARELGDPRSIATSLEVLAAVFALLGDARGAAAIWGAAERLRGEIGSPLAPNERPRYDRRVAAARASLADDAAFNSAWHEGRASTLEQAIAMALAENAERPQTH